jgi:glucan endo-1,3-alpha-glucosidase
VGVDPWQPARVADAFNAAKNCADNGIVFELFLSFDMTSLPCLEPDDANILQTYISTYNSHPNQLRYNGKTFVSTFSGENCYFGTGSVNNGWIAAVKTGLPPIYFVPAFFMNPSEFPSMSVIDGAFNVSYGVVFMHGMSDST